MKRLTQCVKFFWSVRFRALVMFIACFVASFVATIYIGQFSYSFSGYSLLVNSPYKDGFLIQNSNINVKQIDKYTENIRSEKGVVSVAQECRTISFTETSKHIGGNALTFITKEMYDAFPIRLSSGEGFDYESDELECIIAHSYFDSFNVGDVMSVLVSGAKKDDVVDITVTGKASSPQMFISMSAESNQLDSSRLAKEDEIVFVKYNAAAEEVFGSYLNGKRASSGSAWFVELDPEMSESSRDRTISKLNGYGNMHEVSELTERTLNAAKEKISDILPTAIFVTVFLLITIICMTVLSVYKHANVYAVWYNVGASRLRIHATVTSVFAMTIVLAIGLSTVLLKYISSFDAAELPETLHSLVYNIYLDSTSMLAIAAIAVVCVGVAAVTSALALRENDPRQIADKFRE